MKNNKPLEKVNIWIGIIAGIFAILGISIFGDNSLFEKNKSNDESVQFNDNEIGDNSTTIIGGNNTVNYGGTNSDNTQDSKLNDLSISEPEDFSVDASYDINITQKSISGIDILVEAKTSFPADHVTISAISDEITIAPMDMHGGTNEWHFIANFYIKGTYTVIVTAYDSEGRSTSDEFKYKY